MEANVIGVGYEGIDSDGLLSKLRLRGVRTVVDIRLNPISRKRGLSKTALRARLAEDNIGYEHLSALGNPRDNREGFADLEGGAARDAREKFGELLNTEAAREALSRVMELAAAGTVALLCFEQDETRCHREIVLTALRARLIAA
ncbi:DUF488 family protein [Homoserinimonas sp. OAct 916]|uniref:DUF488 domain-containing protein n=1 Tax=Homoserinimonas sp. OAct 916 TaxID=2211450 RepID=UPI000DBE3915|nr:DUF488 domain-containing protein [Homoserinimonas sp. OAct 916]